MSVEECAKNNGVSLQYKNELKRLKAVSLKRENYFRELKILKIERELKLSAAEKEDALMRADGIDSQDLIVYDSDYTDSDVNDTN